MVVTGICKMSAFLLTIKPRHEHDKSMRKRSSSRDVNQMAAGVIQAVAKKVNGVSPKKNRAAVALGRLGGKKGGPARAAKLTPEQRSSIASTAAKTRWQTQSK